MTIKQIFLVSLLFKKVKVRGGGCLFDGGAYLLLWPRGWALIQGRALIRAWTLIRGNTVYQWLPFRASEKWRTHSEEHLPIHKAHKIIHKVILIVHSTKLIVSDWTRAVQIVRWRSRN